MFTIVELVVIVLQAPVSKNDIDICGSVQKARELRKNDVNCKLPKYTNG